MSGPDAEEAPSIEPTVRAAIDALARDRLDAKVRALDPVTPGLGLRRFYRVWLETSGDAPPSAIAHELRGDLDTIVSTALEKERSQRYESVAGLADDIRRFLRGEPTLAQEQPDGQRDEQDGNEVDRHGEVLAPKGSTGGCPMNGSAATSATPQRIAPFSGP